MQIGRPNRYGRTADGVGLLIMTRSDGTEDVASYDLVDDAAIKSRRWRVQSNGYVSTQSGRRGKVVVVTLQRFLLGLQPGDPRCGDHINGDVLDNRRANLRAVTHQENTAHQAIENRTGSSRFRGVSWDKRRNLWYAYQNWNGYMHQIGHYVTEEEAAAAVSFFRAQHQIPSGY